MRPDDDPGPRPRFGAAYWAAMAASLVLVLAGAVVGFFGPRLFPPHPVRTTAPAAGLATRPGASK
jgi:predicted benzoate:H+ symporter BenE